MISINQKIYRCSSCNHIGIWSGCELMPSINKNNEFRQIDITGDIPVWCPGRNL